MPSPTKPPFIRAYNPSTDHDAMIHIFSTTAGAEIKATPSLLAIGAHVWCKPYLAVSAEYCFVLDDGEGNAVGYCIGAPDTLRFVEAWRGVFLPTVDQAVVPPFPPDVAAETRPDWDEDLEGALRWLVWMPEEMGRGDPGRVLPDYPAHLHIDILPEYTGKGYGRLLIERFSAAVKDAGAKGIHLLKASSNFSARSFYLKTGWSEGWKNEGSVCMVKAL